METPLRTEFSDAISETLTSFPNLEVKRAKSKQNRWGMHDAPVLDACERQEEYIQSWPQVIPKDIVYGCPNAYHEGAQCSMPPICSACSRRQHAIEMHEVVLNSKEEIPEPPSNLRNEDKSLFSDEEFQFADPWDSDGLHVNEERIPFRVCHPCYGYLPRSLMPRCALANKLYRDRLPEKFQDLTWIEEQVCVKFSRLQSFVFTNRQTRRNLLCQLHGSICTHETNIGPTVTMCRCERPVECCIYWTIMHQGRFWRRIH